MDKALTQEGSGVFPSDQHDLSARWMPAIFAIDALACGRMADWGRILDGVAAQGFDCILIPPPFLPGSANSLFLAADFTQLHPALGAAAGPGLRGLAQAAKRAGLDVLMDVVLDRVASDGVIAATAPALFAGHAALAELDPRGAAPPHVALARAEHTAELAAFWSATCAAWQDLGIAGFHLLGAGIFAERDIAALRRALPGARLLAECSADGALPPGAAYLDAVLMPPELADSAADIVWQRLLAWQLRGSAVLQPERPYSQRLAAREYDPARRLARCQRAMQVAALCGTGWMLPMGFATGATRPMQATHVAEPEAPVFDLRAQVRELNALRRAAPELLRNPPRLLNAAPVRAVLRSDCALLARTEQAILLLQNSDAAHARAVPGDIFRDAGGRISHFDSLCTPEMSLHAGDAAVLPAGATRILRGSAQPPPVPKLGSLEELARAAAMQPRIGIERITPSLDSPTHALKRLVGEPVIVEADLISDGHEHLAGMLRWREATGAWQETPLTALGNDRWQARFTLQQLGEHEFTIQAWRDRYASFRDELAKKIAAGIDIELERAEGRLLLAERAARRPELAALLLEFDGADAGRQSAILLDLHTAESMRLADPRAGAAESPPIRLRADRSTAEFSSWYEVFPRSLSDDPTRHGSFADVIRHLPCIRDMGFDVLYFPPIHPIGRRNRKGRNNALKAEAGDPGSPYAIGSAEGGHDALHPELGDFADFAALVGAAARHGLEIALDFAVQCAPDHPWLAQHPGWFTWRPDGSLRYAENPPKKYEDIVNVDFYARDAVPDLWVALTDIVLFWASQGVRIFRVDNPHTKPLPFWKFLIDMVQQRYPDTIFLAEAFTRPKLMYRLAKIGFTQSYTYFTWREGKQELQDYVEELSTPPAVDCFRPNFFVNTPDINPLYLQHAPRPAFLIRAALAALLSPSWGLYCGFELCEATPLPGREEYLDSEKYQLRTWNWARPGNIVAEIAQLNLIRRSNPALHRLRGVHFLPTANERVICFEKATPERDNVIFVAISLDAEARQQAVVEIPLWRWHLPDDATLVLEDLLDGGRLTWHGKFQNLSLDPAHPYAIWRAHPAGTP